MEYSKNYKKVIKQSELYADGLINPNHLFMGVLSIKESNGYKILSKIVDIEDANKKIEILSDSIEDRTKEISRLTIDSENIMMQSQLEAKKFKSKNVRTEHLVLSMARSKVIEVVDYDRVEELVIELNNNNNSMDDTNTNKPDQMKKSNKKSKTPMLDEFCTDLTKMASEDKLDPIVGRKRELRRIAQVLSRRKKNNPVLIGDPGCVVGDTEIIIRKINDDTNHENIELDF